MVYNMSKIYVQIRSRFSVRAKRKCINFSQITVATTAVDSGNGVFQTSLDFDKTKALLNISILFLHFGCRSSLLSILFPLEDISNNVSSCVFIPLFLRSFLQPEIFCLEVNSA